MTTKEKEQLLDSVEFLQQEVKDADSKLLSKEAKMLSLQQEKELKVCVQIK